MIRQLRAAGRAMRSRRRTHSQMSVRSRRGALGAIMVTAMACGITQAHPEKPMLYLKFSGPVGSQPSGKIWHKDLGWDPNCGTFYTDKPNVLHIVRDSHAQGGKALAISAMPYPGKPGAYISGRINTSAYKRGNFTYGLVEARIKLPGGPKGAGSGSWPAFWMLGSNFKKVGWPQCGEIDTMESAGNRPNIITGTIHGPGVGAGSPYRLPKDKQFWQHYHVFKVFWTPGSIQFACDAHVYACFTPSDQARGGWVFDHPFYIILNVAEGGAYGGATAHTAVFPQTMLVNWVKAYAWNLHSPRDVRAVNVGRGQIHISWADSAYDQTGFLLERSRTPDFKSLDRSWWIEPMQFSWLDQTATRGHTYFYRVAAVAPKQLSPQINGPRQPSHVLRRVLRKSRWIISAFTPVAHGVRARSAPVSSHANRMGKPILAIHCGAKHAYGIFRADIGYAVGGTPEHGTTHAILTKGVPGAAPQAIYQYSRYGTFAYHLHGFKPGGRYRVVLDLAEYYWTAPRKRLFAVFAHGHIKLTDVDIYLSAGGKDRATDDDFTVRANRQGAINLNFVSQRDNAQVNGIEVFRDGR